MALAGVSFSLPIESPKTLLIVISWIKSVSDSDDWVAMVIGCPGHPKRENQTLMSMTLLAY